MFAIGEACIQVFTSIGSVLPVTMYIISIVIEVVAMFITLWKLLFFKV